MLDDHRITRDSGSSATAMVPPTSPCRRSCRCHHGRDVGLSSTDNVGCGASRRSASSGAAPSGGPVAKPWARTLRDYGSGDKSPSPVHSRRSTPDSSTATPRRRNCKGRGNNAVALDSSSSAELLDEVSTTANKLKHRMTTRTTSQIAVESAAVVGGRFDNGLGATRSDSTLETRMTRQAMRARAQSAIPSSTSLGAMIRRKGTTVPSTVSTDKSPKTANLIAASVDRIRLTDRLLQSTSSSTSKARSVYSGSKISGTKPSKSNSTVVETRGLGTLPKKLDGKIKRVYGAVRHSSTVTTSTTTSSAADTGSADDAHISNPSCISLVPSGGSDRVTVTTSSSSTSKHSTLTSARQSLNKQSTALVTSSGPTQRLAGKDKRPLKRNDSTASAISCSSSGSSGTASNRIGYSGKLSAEIEDLPRKSGDSKSRIQSDYQLPLVRGCTANILEINHTSCGRSQPPSGGQKEPDERLSADIEVPLYAKVKPSTEDESVGDKNVEPDISKRYTSASSDTSHRVTSYICDTIATSLSAINTPVRYDASDSRHETITGNCSSSSPSNCHVSHTVASCDVLEPIGHPTYRPNVNDIDVSMNSSERTSDEDIDTRNIDSSPTTIFEYRIVGKVSTEYQQSEMLLRSHTIPTAVFLSGDNCSAERHKMALPAYSPAQGTETSNGLRTQNDKPDRNSKSRHGNGDRVIATVHPMPIASTPARALDEAASATDTRIDGATNSPVKRHSHDISKTNNVVSSTRTRHHVESVQLERSRDFRLTLPCASEPRTQLGSGSSVGVTAPIHEGDCEVTAETSNLLSEVDSLSSDIDSTVRSRLVNLASLAGVISDVESPPSVVQASQAQAIISSTYGRLRAIDYDPALVDGQLSATTMSSEDRCTRPFVPEDTSPTRNKLYGSISMPTKKVSPTSVVVAVRQLRADMVEANQNLSTTGATVLTSPGGCSTESASNNSNNDIKHRDVKLNCCSIETALDADSKHRQLSFPENNDVKRQSEVRINQQGDLREMGLEIESQLCTVSQYSEVSPSWKSCDAPYVSLTSFRDESDVSSTRSTPTRYCSSGRERHTDPHNANDRALDNHPTAGFSFSLPRDFRRTKPTENVHFRLSHATLQHRRRLAANDCETRRRSPELSCFRQMSSPDDSGGQYSVDRDESTTMHINRCRSQLFKRFIPFGQKSSADRGNPTLDAWSHSSNYREAVVLRNAYQSSLQSGNEPADNSRSSRDRDRDDQVNVELRHYRSLSRRRDDDQRDGLNHCPPTPPLAVFLSSEDISASVFPLRHAVSEPFGRGSPTRSTYVAGFEKSTTGGRQPRNTMRLSGTLAENGGRGFRERPRSECFGLKVANKVFSTLHGGSAEWAGKNYALSAGISSDLSSDQFSLKSISTPTLNRKCHRSRSQPRLIQTRSKPPQMIPMSAHDADGPGLTLNRSSVAVFRASTSAPDVLMECSEEVRSVINAQIRQRQRSQFSASSKRGAAVSSDIATKTLYSEGGRTWSDEDLDRRSLGASSRTSDRSRMSWTTAERPPSRLDETGNARPPLYAEAIWDHVTVEPDELDLLVGDEIEIINMSSDLDWWWGQTQTAAGWFPAAFVAVKPIYNGRDALGRRLQTNSEWCDVTPTSLCPSVTSLQDSMVNARCCVVREILKAEHDYVRHLYDVIEGYLEKARKRPEMFNDEKIATIFGNVEEIYQFSKSFFEDLEKHVNHHQPEMSELGSCFLRHKSGFEIYSYYCNNQSFALDELTRLHRDANYQRFFETCRLQQRMIAIPLEGFLLTPVQKICKYPLQLRELLCCTWLSHPDYRPLEAALDAMRDMAALVNERKRKMESFEKLAEWQKTVAQWQGSLLTDISSELIFFGEMTKISMHGWHRDRIFYLFDHQMIYLKKDLLWRHLLVYRGRINMDHCIVHDVPDGRDLMFGVSVKNAFKLYERVDERWYLLACRCLSDKSRWMRALETERQRVNEDKANGFSIDSLKRRLPASFDRPTKRNTFTNNRAKSKYQRHMSVPEGDGNVRKN